MDKQQIQQLRGLPIEGVAERLGMEVKRHMALCPFHDDHHASLSFNVRKNSYRCFVCDAHGGTIDLVMGVGKTGFREACSWLNLSQMTHAPVRCASSPSNFEGERLARSITAPSNSSPKLGEVPVRAEECVTKPFDASKYERFFERPYLSPAARHFLFEERRLDERVVRWCRLTSWRDRNGVEWLQIPYYDREGHLIGIQNRNLNYQHQGNPNSSPSSFRARPGISEIPHQVRDEDAPRADGGVCLPRFRFPKGSRCGIYNLPVLNMLRPGEALYITEGASDCWAMLSSGHKAIAIPSATLLSRQDKEQLSTLHSQLSTEFHMYPDRDAPGERLFLQLQQVLPNLQHHQLPLNCKDFGEYFAKLKIEN